MQHLGELISLIVALSWTATAIFADIASHRLGALSLNLIRMGLSIVFLSVLLLIVRLARRAESVFRLGAVAMRSSLHSRT